MNLFYGPWSLSIRPETPRLTLFFLSLVIVSFVLNPASVNAEILEGTLRVVIVDHESSQNSETKYVLETVSPDAPSDTIELSVSPELESSLRPSLVTGAQVRISGNLNANIAEVKDFQIVSQEPTLRDPTGPQNTLVVPVNFTNGSVGSNCSAANITSSLFSETGLSTNTHYQYVSRGTLSVIGRVANPVNLGIAFPGWKELSWTPTDPQGLSQ